MTYFDESKIVGFEKRFGYRFKDRTLLYQALTHASWVYEQKNAPWPHQERLEFLGDAVLECAVSQHLYALADELPEGQMTALRQLIVREETLAALAESLGVGALLLLGQGEAATGGAHKSSNLEDTMEALFAAVLEDSDFETARSLILRLLAPWIAHAQAGRLIYDYKSKLLEVIQETDKAPNVAWVVVAEEGPAHDRMFTMELRYRGEALAVGKGRTKKAAEQAAAKAALEQRAL